MNEKTGTEGVTQGAAADSPECVNLHAAYLAFRASPGDKERYLAVLAAMEAELKADAYAYLPVRAAMPVAAIRDGRIQWSVTDTPKGRMLSVFTSRDEVERHPAPASVGVKLRAAFRMAIGDRNLSGVILNPFDGHHGVPIERRNLEVMAVHIRGEKGRMPRLHPGVVSDAVYRLWNIAVGVPTAVYDVSAEVEKLGGMERLLKPLLEKWQTKLQNSKDEFPEPMAYVKAVLRDVVSSGFVYGAMALKRADMALDVDVERCIDALPGLRGDLVQNLDEYLILISDAVRSDLVEPNETQVRLLVAGNLPIIAFGAFCFGLGWGMAKDAESQGVMALAELRDRQQTWLEKFKQNIIEKVRKEEEGKENGRAE